MKKQFRGLILCSLFSCMAFAKDDVHGKTHLRTVGAFESGSPMRVSLANHKFNSEHCDNMLKNGLQFSAFGGKNTLTDDAAAYFFPYGHKVFTVQGQQTFTKSNKVRATTGTAATAHTQAVDNNTDTSYMRPWNFGITHASLYDPHAYNSTGGASGDGLGYPAQFKATIAPEFHTAHAGVAMAWRHHFSEDSRSFWFEASTALEWKRNEVKLNEVNNTPKQTTFTTMNTDFTNTNTVTTNDLLQEELHLVWINTVDRTGGSASNPTGTNWPVDATVTNVTASVDSVEDAFKGTVENLPENKQWNYGKIDGAQKKVRLSDVEVKLGYNFICEDNYFSNGYLGVVVPTGNKADAEFLGAPVVGNGFHFAVMMGSSTEVQLSSEDDWNVFYRMDLNSRYLFKNKQKRSFDLLENEGSRYLMVWEKDKWELARTALFGAAAGAYSEVRNYSAGINFFTRDMYVTPGFQLRFNQSLLFESRKCFIEMGWNIFAREAEKVSLVDPWTENIAFPDAVTTPLYANQDNTVAPHAGGLFVTNNNKLYKNETSVLPLKTNAPTQDWDASLEITEDMFNLESAASPQTVAHTPYVSFAYNLGNEEGNPKSLGLGASYEFAQNNRSLSQWNLWGKFECNF